MTGIVMKMNLQGVDEAVARLSQMADPAALTFALDEAFIGGLTRGVSMAQALAPVRSGNYRRTLQWNRLGPLAYIWGTEDPLAQILEFGSRPHMIYPRRKKVLRWRTDLPFQGIRGTISRQATKDNTKKGIKAGDWYSSSSGSQTDIFARFVRHPGTKAYPHLRPTADSMSEDITARVQRALLRFAGGK